MVAGVPGVEELVSGYTLDSMITVVIKMNGKAIYARTAINVTGKKISRGDCDVYDVDDGRTLYYKRDLGAIPLAIEMLKGIKEP